MYQRLNSNLMEIFFAGARFFLEILLNVKLLKKLVQIFIKDKNVKNLCFFGVFVENIKQNLAHPCLKKLFSLSF